MKERKYKLRHIPRSKLYVGIIYCIDQAERLVKAAISLVENNHTYAAAALLSFGVEEYGKALCLTEYRNSKEDMLTVDGAIFQDHAIKLEKAEATLPKGTLLIRVALEEAEHITMFNPDLKDTFIFDPEDTVLNLATRLNQLYLDWVEEKQNWNIIPLVEAYKVEECANTVLAYLSKLKQEVMST